MRALLRAIQSYSQIVLSGFGDKLASAGADHLNAWRMMKRGAFKAGLHGRHSGHSSPLNSAPARWLCLISILSVALSWNVEPADASTTVDPKKADGSGGNGSQEPLELQPISSWMRNWSVQFSVAFISPNNIQDLFTGGIELSEGDAGGQLYTLQLNYTAHRFEIPFYGRVLKPQFEPYVALTLVDENSSSLFPDYNGGVGFRWIDFPWDRWVETSLFMGIGFSYSSQIYTEDRVRHPGQDRSHVKFDWPIQFTFALPRWTRHQSVLFIDHQSGGRIFDQGGVTSFGIGYRLEF